MDGPWAPNRRGIEDFPDRLAALGAVGDYVYLVLTSHDLELLALIGMLACGTFAHRNGSRSPHDGYLLIKT